MFLVVSYWEAMPGKEAELDALSPRMLGLLSRQPGVVLAEEFKSDGKYVAVHGYRDEAAYRAILDNPDNEFSRALTESDDGTVARWIHSERGETFPHEEA